MEPMALHVWGKWSTPEIHPQLLLIRNLCSSSALKHSSPSLSMGCTQWHPPRKDRRDGGVGKPDKHDLIQRSRSTPTVRSHLAHRYPWYHGMRRTLHLCDVLPPNPMPQSSHENNTRYVQLRGILQDSWQHSSKLSSFSKQGRSEPRGV